MSRRHERQLPFCHDRITTGQFFGQRCGNTFPHFCSSRLGKRNDEHFRNINGLLGIEEAADNPFD